MPHDIGPLGESEHKLFVVCTRAPGSVAAGLTESISPATSWISLASMARSLARSWLILIKKRQMLSIVQYGSKQLEVLGLFRDGNFFILLQQRSDLITVRGKARPKQMQINDKKKTCQTVGGFICP